MANFNRNFNLQTSHPLIQSEQTYVLDRKLISIHSVDRDYQKWPNSNKFGIELGEAFHNVQSMRLINFAVPSNNYTFSTAYQNTMMSFSYTNTLKFDYKAIHTNGQAGKQMNDTLTGCFGPNTGFGPGPSTGVFPTNVALFVSIYDSGTGNRVLTDYSTIGSGAGGGYPILANGPTDWNGEWELRWTPPEFSITIPEGSYSATAIAETVETLMNQKIFNITSQGGNAGTGTGYNFIPGPPGPLTFANISTHHANSASAWNAGSLTGIKPFIVYYNSVTNRLLIGVKDGTFTLNFAKQEIYNPSCDVNKAIFHQYTKWGLPSYLGFDKKNYSGTVTDISNNNDLYLKSVGGLYLPFETQAPWLTPTGTEIITGTGDNTAGTYTATQNYNVASVEASYNLDINGEDALYMEIDRYNSIDEIYPYSERTGHLYNNDLGHRVNGSFAKIPLTHVPFGQEMGSRNNFVLNVFHSDPPVQRIDRLKFTFRYHDGRLVDFKNLPFSFTLELNMLKDEQERGKIVRVPALYNL